MDKSWINSRLFSKAHLDGVKEFMQFVSQRFHDSEDILCPCRRCLNQIHVHKGQVEDHLYLNGMASTYTHWIHHGEPLLDAIINECPIPLEDNTGLDDDGCTNEVEEHEPNDRIPDMVHELYAAEGGGTNSMFATILEYIKTHRCQTLSQSKHRRLLAVSFPNPRRDELQAAAMPPGRKVPGHSNPHPANPSPQSSIATLGKTATPTAGGQARCIGAWRDELQAAATPPWRKDAVDSCPHPTNPNPHPSTTTLGKTAGAAARPQQELAPGRKAAAHLQQEVAAAPLTDIEKVRAQNIIENNQVFRRLGISVLSSQLKNARAIVEDEGSQKSGSEYGPQDNEGYEEEEVSKIANISAKGRRGSKRVMPPRQQFEPRVTRQRTTASLSLTTPTKDALVIPRSPIQNEDLNPIGDEDALDETIEQGRRGRSMGKGLDKISRGLSNKICINFSEGKRRPEAPIESAKLASENGIIIRKPCTNLPTLEALQIQGERVSSCKLPWQSCWAIHHGH